MRFHVASYRAGHTILAATPAFGEIAQVVSDIPLHEVSHRQEARQARTDAKGKEGNAGIQRGLNEILRERFSTLPSPWRAEVAVFDPDPGTRKGFWTMDFHKRFSGLRNGVGVEVTFNHAEALPWTLIRPTLAYQSESVLPGSRIDAAVVIIGTDQLKGERGSLRMDSAVGTYERLRTLLPKMKWVLPAPMVILGLDWAEGGQAGEVDEIDLYSLTSGLPPTQKPRIKLHDLGEVDPGDTPARDQSPSRADG